MAADAVLFIGWNRPHPAQQQQAYGFLAGEALTYLKRLEGQWFERMEIVGLTAHGGDLNGFILLQGSRAKLDELRRTDEFEAFSMKMGELFDRYGVVPGVNWEGIQKVLKRTGM
jgi:hypothetical protein